MLTACDAKTAYPDIESGVALFSVARLKNTESLDFFNTGRFRIDKHVRPSFKQKRPADSSSAGRLHFPGLS